MANKREADVAGKFKPKYEETPQTTPEKPVMPPTTPITPTGNPGRATGADIMNEMLWGQKESPEEPTNGYIDRIYNVPNYNNDMSGRLLKMAQGNTAEQNALAREYRKGSTPRWQELFDNSQKSYWDDNIGQLYGVKANNAMGDTLGTMAADNGGNIDSYAAANANQQYLSYLDKGINAMINQANAQQANGYNALTGWGNTNANVISALGESLSPMISGAGNAYATEAQNLANTYDYLNNANRAANDYMAALYGTGAQGQESNLGQNIAAYLKYLQDQGADLSQYLSNPQVLLDDFLNEYSESNADIAANILQNQLNNLYAGMGVNGLHGRYGNDYTQISFNDLVNGGNGFEGLFKIKDPQKKQEYMTNTAQLLKQLLADANARHDSKEAEHIRILQNSFQPYIDANKK